MNSTDGGDALRRRGQDARADPLLRGPGELRVRRPEACRRHPLRNSLPDAEVWRFEKHLRKVNLLELETIAPALAICRTRGDASISEEYRVRRAHQRTWNIRAHLLDGEAAL
jgi:hypothetical protein